MLESRIERQKLVGDSIRWEVLTRGVSLGYKPTTGRWYARVSVQAKYHRRTIGTADDVAGTGISYREAAKAALKLIPDTEPTLTVGEAFENYQEYIRTEKKTEYYLVKSYRKHIAPRFKNRRLDTLSTKELRSWLYGLINQVESEEVSTRVRTDQTKLKPVSKSTANRVWNYFRAALNMAYRDGYRCNPRVWQNVQRFRNTEQSRTRWLSDEEISKLLAIAKEPFRSLLLLGLLTGCRYGELCAAKVEHFDGKNLYIPTSKSGKSRHIPLTEQGIQTLERLTKGRDKAEYLLNKADNTTWKHSNQSQRMTELCKQADIDHCNFHGLRHTYASRLLNNGAHPSVVAELLGHRDTTMVQKHYGHLLRSTLETNLRKHFTDLLE